MNYLSLFLLGALSASPLFAYTIAEKKESFLSSLTEGVNNALLRQLNEVNEALEEKKHALEALYAKIATLREQNAPLDLYAPLVAQVRTIKKERAEIHRLWRLESATSIQEERYALWNQPHSTIEQLVADYGAEEFVYLVPPDIGAIPLSLHSNLPIPQESWGECLSLILGQYGIGIRELNPYIRELYLLQNDGSGIKAILHQPQELDIYPPHTQVCYILSPESRDPRSDLLFLQKFAHPTHCKLEILDGKIFLTASVETIQELLKLYSFAKAEGQGDEVLLVSLNKIEAKEMETLLLSAFRQEQFSGEGSSLRIIPLEHLSHSLFLTGNRDEVKKAESLIRTIESQLENPQEKTIFWYTTKHSDAEDLANLLARVYDLLIGGEAHALPSGREPASGKKAPQGEPKEMSVAPVVHVKGSGGTQKSHKTADGQNNFLVDPKTGAIIMVVEHEALPKIKALLKKLDVPKKMVKIEVLLVEKKISNNSSCGLNLLKLGSEAKQLVETGIAWEAGGPLGAGILEFILSRGAGGGIPAYDLAYKFLLGQDDVQINASPSVTTINQTPATIAIVEEMSINSGSDEHKNTIYNRAQYGITMQIIPTINIDEGDDSGPYITLDTDLTFDTTDKNTDSRPNVTRRHVKNHVRIADGQTVILGGLRRKSSSDHKESIPFIGELPGIGKLFSMTEMHDSSTEMFIFITPTILSDTVEENEQFRQEELKKRPGDIPEFLQELTTAQKAERRRLFQQSLSALFGRETAPATPSRSKERKEYDGR